METGEDGTVEAHIDPFIDKVMVGIVLLLCLLLLYLLINLGEDIVQNLHSLNTKKLKILVKLKKTIVISDKKQKNKHKHKQKNGTHLHDTSQTVW